MRQLELYKDDQPQEDLSGTDCIVRYEDGKWHKARIINHCMDENGRLSGKFEVRFQDFNTQAVVTLADLRLPNKWTTYIQFRAGIHGVTVDGNVAEARRLIKVRPLCIKARDKDGNNPLLVALGAGIHPMRKNKNHLIKERLQIAEAMIRHDSRLDIRNTHGWAPIHLSCQRGYTNIVKLILEHDGSVDYPAMGMSRGKTALMCAAEYGRLDIIPLLLLSTPPANCERRMQGGDNVWQMATPAARKLIEVIMSDVVSQTLPECAMIRNMNVGAWILKIIIEFTIKDPYAIDD